MNLLWCTIAARLNLQYAVLVQPKYAHTNHLTNVKYYQGPREIDCLDAWTRCPSQQPLRKRKHDDQGFRNRTHTIPMLMYSLL